MTRTQARAHWLTEEGLDTTRRLQRAAHLLQHSHLALGEIALSCGFASASHFSNRFRQAFGATPGLYRQALAH